MFIFPTILAPIVVGCVLATFNHWLETQRKKKRKSTVRLTRQDRAPLIKLLSFLQKSYLFLHFMTCFFYLLLSI
ncbi:type I toxin-antitoxin system Fst family toxin [Listeria grandensis]|uniref:Type I toxin-antitoxin system Fst family toxin n=1 Tax=Listeria grandensis TaxID=1494963 RepID=A0A7X1CRB0_9LIST|nr:type I toxin-antitoxin system Fst family toxin [Listeria grandensis]MBC1937899.1 type I toxin-antitoxin system Fst family toxin [Listeria grandensis]